MTRTIRATLFLLALLSAPLLKATHLLGGNLGYQYLGETTPGSQVYRYRIYMQFYMNCGPDSNWPDFATLLAQSGGTLPVGVYTQDPLNPNADKQQQAQVDLVLLDSAQIVPDLPDNCTVGDGLCTLLGTFSGTVDLPLNFGGYHVYYQMCCRNLTILNLNDPNGTGIGYYAYIPPPLVNNSSPVWLGIPTPFMCINDTSTFINSATDPDGDQLVFSFETPYNSTNQLGGINPPPPVLPWPVPEVQYNGGYSASLPFGAGGYSFINGATGLTSYQPVLQGNYVISVEVKEFRNGFLIGRTRRDLQLQAIPCPANTTPQTNGALTTSYTVNAGDQLCFNMGFLDADADTVTLTADGGIFDGNLFTPPATITAPISGNGSVSSQFCWSTACDQGQDQPYLFSVSVTDNGCPPKTLDVVFQVQVVPFVGPTLIAGPQQVCTNQAGSIYSTADISGAEFTWTVSGGTLVTGQGSNSITVNWGAPGPGLVSVSATNALGCTSSPVDLSVNIAALPTANAGADITICPGQSTVLGGTPTGPAGSSFTWSPAGTLSSATAANPTATPTANTDYVVAVTNTGCLNRDTVHVTISVPTVNAGTNAAICAGDTTQLHATGTGSVSWGPAAGLSATNVPDPFAFPTTTTTYIATLTDSVTCVATDSVTVTVNALPTVDAGPDTTVCTAASLVIGGSPTGPSGSVFLWTVQGQFLDTIANPTVLPQGPTIYTVLVTDGQGCSASDSLAVNVLPIPDVDAGPDLSVCAGGSIQLNGSGAGQLLWTPAFGLSDATIPNPIASPETTITYTLTVTGSNTCTNSDQATVVVNVLPTANAGPDRTICVGDSVQIGTPGPGAFVWTPSNTLTAADIATPLAFPLISTTYIVTLTDTSSCTRSDSVLVTVNAPTTAGTDGSATVCSDGAPFDVTGLLGGADPNGTWTPGTVFTPGNGSQTFTYVVNGAPGCDNDTAVVAITEINAPQAGADGTRSVCSAAATFNLVDVLTGTIDANGVWSGPGGNVPDGTYIPGTSTAGDYLYVVAGNAPCVADTAKATIIEVISAEAGTGSAVSICGSGVPFNLADSLSESPDANGQWLAPDLTLHGGQFDPATDVAGAYRYVAGFGTLCPDTAIISVTISNPSITIVGDNTICIGDSTQLTGSGGVSYSWSPSATVSDPSISDPWFDPIASTDYTLTVTDANGCSGNANISIVVSPLPTVDAGPDQAYCVSGPVTIGGSPTGPAGSFYSWGPTTGLTGFANANPTANPTTTTTYTVVVVDANQCLNTDSMTVTVNALPFLFAGNDTSFCLNGSVQLNAQGTGDFAWSPATGLSDAGIANPVASPAISTTYTVTLTDANTTCTSSDDITVVVLGLPSANAGPDLWVCPGFDVQLQGSGGGSFGWLPGASLNNATIANPQASPLNTTTYTLTVTDGNGCTASDETIVTVNTDPPIDAGADQTLCQGQQAVLGGSPTSVPGSSFQWSPSAGLNDATASNPVATPTATTVYTLTVLNDTCTSQAQVLVSLQGVANAEFNVRLEPGCETVRAFFVDQSTGTQQWHWDFGDGTTSNEQFPQHEFAYGAPLHVVLTATDAFGCTGTDTLDLPISSFEEYVDYEIPNVFTPNHDGKNDLFTINSNGVLGPCVSMFVFNRWGQKVFESFGNNLEWDGRNFAGEECVNGTYFYVIELKGMSFNGDVYLNR